MTIRRIWKRYVLAPTIAASVWMAWDLVYGQTIKINSDLGPIPAALVDEAAWSIRERLGINMQIVGTSNVDCEQGHVIVRRASPAEWQAFAFPESVYAAASQCGGTGWGQVIWHPTKPVTLIGMRHELAHTAGCWTHFNILSWNVMFGDPYEPFLTADDLDCIRARNWWPRSGENECFAEVGPNLSLYIPSINGFAAWLRYQGGMDWTLYRSRATNVRCHGNTLAGQVAELRDVRGYGILPLTYVRLRQVNGIWRLEAAR